MAGFGMTLRDAMAMSVRLPEGSREVIDRIFRKPVCFRSNPNPVEQAENCCNDCKHSNQCMEKMK